MRNSLFRDDHGKTRWKHRYLVSEAIVCVGEKGRGPWQKMELRAFEEFVRRGIPVIPVILPCCKNVPELPLFLRQFTWVDLRKERPDPLMLLKWGSTGRRP
jgi:hypothetical protein